MYTLRKALRDASPPPLFQDAEGLALNPAAVDVDAPRFERLMSEGTPDALQRAVTLYRGDLLHGFSLDEAAFEEWLTAERERLRELAIHALATLLAHQEATGATERGIQTAGLGKLFLHAGRSERARESLTTAITMYREMGMRFWLEKAEREFRACT